MQRTTRIALIENKIMQFITHCYHTMMRVAHVIWPTWQESFCPSLKPAHSILSVIRDAPYPVLRHSVFDKIGTVTSCKFTEMSPCSAH